ncbi:MAG: peptidoglycan DD-metalloendopeptidase family protein [Chloroflexi bacterium]|nr:peptidoglycan DD-metalloendopeptidase family protein [Chloroflexota bacterium]
MTTLHMETDRVRAMASQLKQVADDLRTQGMTLNNSAQTVDWMGPSRDEFVNEVNVILRILDQEVAAGDILENRLEREVTEWENIDTKNVDYNRFLSTNFSANQINLLMENLAILPVTGAVLGLSSTSTYQPSSQDQPFYNKNEYWGKDKYTELISQYTKEIADKENELTKLPKMIDDRKFFIQRNDELLKKIEEELNPPRKWVNDLLGTTAQYQKMKDDLLKANQKNEALIKSYENKIATLPSEINNLKQELQKLNDDAPRSPVGTPVQLSQSFHSSGKDKNGQYRGVAVDLTSHGQSTPVVQSIRKGKVVGVGFENGGYGNFVKVLQDDGIVVLYAHLDKTEVKVGDILNKAGVEIGHMGNTGYSTGQHLHLEFRAPDNMDPNKYKTDTTALMKSYNEKNFDPIEYLKANGCNL